MNHSDDVSVGIISYGTAFFTNVKFQIHLNGTCAWIEEYPVNIKIAKPGIA